jgi:D-3-phosphoglycerate dehydrogenase / 2-oxoglutarate reductase
MKAFVTAQLTEHGLQVLAESLTLEFGGWGYEGVKLTPFQLVERAQDCEILIIGYEDIDAYVLKNLPRLKFIACTRGGIENIDVHLVRQAGVTLTNTPGRNASAVADLTLGLMLAATRKIALTHRLIMEQRWEEVPWDISGNTPYKRFAGSELEGKTLGLIGFGAIGQKVAKRAQGFDMQVLSYDPYIDPLKKPPEVEFTTLDQLFQQSDFISLHCKLTKDTREIINRHSLSKMKSTAYLVNTARGDLVNEEDLYLALKEKSLAGAALDVLVEEPMNPMHAFLSLNNIIITPHIGGASNDIISHQTRMIVEDVLHFLEGKQPVHVVC